MWQDEQYNMTIFWRKARPSSTHSRRSDRSTSQSKVGCCSNLGTKRLQLLLHKFRQIRQIRFGAIALQNAFSKRRMVKTFLPKKWPPKAVPMVQAGLTGPKRPWTHMKFGLPGQLLRSAVCAIHVCANS